MSVTEALAKIGRGIAQAVDITVHHPARVAKLLATVAGLVSVLAAQGMLPPDQAAAVTKILAALTAVLTYLVPNAPAPQDIDEPEPGQAAEPIEAGEPVTSPADVEAVDEGAGL